MNWLNESVDSSAPLQLIDFTIAERFTWSLPAYRYATTDHVHVCPEACTALSAVLASPQ
jgi:hypothetical protein